MAAAAPTMDAANATHRGAGETGGERAQAAQRGRRPPHSPGDRRILPEIGAFSWRSAHSPGERTILPETPVAQRNLAALATTIHRTLLLTTAQYTWARQGT